MPHHSKLYSQVNENHLPSFSCSSSSTVQRPPPSAVRPALSRFLPYACSLSPAPWELNCATTRSTRNLQVHASFCDPAACKKVMRSWRKGVCHGGELESDAKESARYWRVLIVGAMCGVMDVRKERRGLIACARHRALCRSRHSGKPESGRTTQSDGGMGQ